MNATIVKTYFDSSIDILTLPVDSARGHVATRTADPNSFGIKGITVTIGRATHEFVTGEGWTSTKKCDNASVEHPGFPCNHPAV